MARPSKRRFVCRMPECQLFYPSEKSDSMIEILLSIEEYEAIRLIDYDGKTQADAASHMSVSRTTIQALYTEARKKISRFLVEGTLLKIEGGNYILCSHNKICNFDKNRKGDLKMKIAVTYENGQIFQHFGHTEQFKVYEVEDGKIISSEIIDTNGSGHGALAGFLADHNVSTLICGGIGGGARNALAEAGVKIYPGASGDADAQISSFLQGKLQYDPNTMCNHHSHEEGHSCGNHGCGNHGCH
ncbi:NifB/NifX family molybdenum-iron cluster-binding protein [Clostridium sp. BJN0001]|uniref:NifB/NifX family molybdenum-iron cluster-binding protein n=1 Tax=Clostridium sp. BJN0001 TaxID=2930219 RepID=UPI001FD10917|nr:NifB/NifX family molybdenum-iron cluster-binding protein [Clostridium sp. BJN0001]